MNVLDLPLIARVRRNHALEHATIHVLTEKYRPLKVVGRSTFNGYYLYGNLTTGTVAEAAHEALARLRAGEHHLAVHPNCGTNIVTAGSLAGLATFAVLSNSKKRRIESLPSALLAATTALFLAQPLGAKLQANVTTMADLGDLTITEIRCEERGNVMVHFIATS
jgi:hypothetical protein